jgi:hypothetical protein
MWQWFWVTNFKMTPDARWELHLSELSEKAIRLDGCLGLL